jgi:hypothetical protein
VPKNERRRFLQLSGIAALAGCGQQGTKTDEEQLPSALGKPIRAYGERSPHETAKRVVPDLKRPQVGSTRTPLAETEGIITPASLHFERHHAGVPISILPNTRSSCTASSNGRSSSPSPS